MNYKILVGITIQENSKHLIEEGYKLSKELNAPLHILHIRKGETIFDEPSSSKLLSELFHYAGDLGGEVHFICGEHISQVFTSFAKENHITHLLIGETPSYLATNAPTMYDTLTHELSDIKIIVLQRENFAAEPNEVSTTNNRSSNNKPSNKQVNIKLPFGTKGTN